MPKNEKHENVNANQIEFIDLDNKIDKLRQEINGSERINRVLGRVIVDVFQRATNKIHSKYSMKHKNERGEYECILLNHTAYMKCMRKVIEILFKKKLRTDEFYPYYDSYGERFNSYEYSFVDAGCGVGHKVFLAQVLGFSNVTGIDIEPQYLSAAKKVIKQFFEDGFKEDLMFKKIKFIKQNILETDYSDYDVIYFYVPLREHAKEVEFEKRVVETAKSGAIIIGISNHYLHDTKNNGLIKHSSYVFEKQ